MRPDKFSYSLKSENIKAELTKIKNVDLIPTSITFSCIKETMTA